MSFIDYKRDLDSRAEQYVYRRTGEPVSDPIRKYRLDTDDYALIGNIEKAFTEVPNEELDSGRD